MTRNEILRLNDGKGFEVFDKLVHNGDYLNITGPNELTDEVVERLKQQALSLNRSIIEVEIPSEGLADSEESFALFADAIGAATGNQVKRKESLDPGVDLMQQFEDKLNPNVDYHLIIKNIENLKLNLGTAEELMMVFRNLFNGRASERATNLAVAMVGEVNPGDLSPTDSERTPYNIGENFHVRSE